MTPAVVAVLGLLVIAPAHGFFHRVSTNQVCDPKGLWLDRIRSGVPELAQCINLCDADVNCNYAVFHAAGDSDSSRDRRRRKRAKPWCYTYEVCAHTRSSERQASLHVKDGAPVFTDNGIINAKKKKNKKTKGATNNGMGTYDGGKVSMGKSMGMGKGKSMGTPKSPKSMGTPKSPKSMGTPKSPKSMGKSMGKKGKTGKGGGGGGAPSGGTSGEPDRRACDACETEDALKMLRFEVMPGASAGTALASDRGMIECSSTVGEACWMQEENTDGVGCPSTVQDFAVIDGTNNCLGITDEWAAFTDTSCAPFATALNCFDADTMTPLPTKRLTYRDHNSHNIPGEFRSNATAGTELAHALGNSLFVVHNDGADLPAAIKCEIEGPRQLCFGPPGVGTNSADNIPTTFDIGEPGISTCSPFTGTECVTDIAYSPYGIDVFVLTALCKDTSGFVQYEELYGALPGLRSVAGSYDPYFKQTVTLDTSCGGTTPLAVGDQFGFMRLDGFLTAGGVDDVQCGQCAESDPSLNRVCVGPDFALDSYNGGSGICESELFGEIAIQTECEAPPQDCLICGGGGGGGGGGYGGDRSIRQAGSKDALQSIVFTWTEYNNQAIDIEVPGQNVLVLGDTVTVTSASGGRFGANTEFIISGESTVLHTSCSQPIYVGLNLRFLTGVLTLIDFTTANGRSVTQSCSDQPPYEPPVTDAETCSCFASSIPDCLMNGRAGPVLNYEGLVDGIPPRCCPHFWVSCAIAWNVGFLIDEGGTEADTLQNSGIGYMDVLTAMANTGIKASLENCNEDDIGRGPNRNGLDIRCYEDYALQKYGTDVKYGLVNRDASNSNRSITRILNAEQDGDAEPSRGTKTGIIAGAFVGAFLLATVLVLVVSKCREQRKGAGNTMAIALSTSSEPSRRLQAARILAEATNTADRPITLVEVEEPEVATVTESTQETALTPKDGTLLMSGTEWVAEAAEAAETKLKPGSSHAGSDHSTPASDTRRSAML